MPTIAICAGLLAALTLVCINPVPVSAQVGTGAQMSLARQGALADPIAARDLISIFRANNNLPPLTIDPALQASALAKARAMASSGKASGGVDGLGRVTSVSNVSAGYHTVADAFSGWRGAAQQKANMLNPRVRRMGIASVYAPGSKYQVFWALVLTD